jgi:hypothetical protein
MKRLFLWLFLAVACTGIAGAQDWWRGTLGPAPPTPPSSPVGGDTRSSPPVRRRDPSDYPPRRTEPRVERPKPPSKAELKRQEEVRKREAAQTQQIHGELARLSGSFQIQRVQSSIELTPRSDRSFGLPGDTGERPFGRIMAAELSGNGTPASRIPLENLRRAAAVLAPIVQALKTGNSGMSDEDMSFLASQSALAMEGAPLAVEVRESPAGHEEDVRRLAQQAQDVETASVAAQQATVERLRVEEQLVKVQRELLSGKEDKGALEKRREEILRAYKTAYTNESDKKAEVQSKTGRVVVVWDSGGTRR